MRVFKRLKILGLIALGLLCLSSSSAAQISVSVPVTVTIIIPRSVYMTSSPLRLDLEITPLQIQGPQPFELADWHVNIDAITSYRLNSTMVTVDTNIQHADPGDFFADCRSADDWGECDEHISLLEPDPGTRRGTGLNTAGTNGADFRGKLFLDLRDWDVAQLPGYYIGVIIYRATDTTP
ncbi:MAG: hypothetical protein RMJ96_02560 [Candidatus Bipolaricaulota bacterium]|nr:hypothetical protein [Candidatus Bipolaricaulota bacterium]MDW8110472.1 hypothetical protein [Candidatus Bipolaricaulota bacterium]MDW8329153.1 hypothetical protein [Candidatus Bipolaricaulota bacterium]